MLKRLLILITIAAFSVTMTSCSKKSEKELLIDYIKGSEDVFKSEKTVELMKDTTKKDEFTKYMEEQSKELLSKSKFGTEDSVRAVFSRYQNDSDVVKAVNDFNTTYQKVMMDFYKQVYGVDPHQQQQDMQQVPKDSQPQNNQTPPSDNQTPKTEQK